MGEIIPMNGHHRQKHTREINVFGQIQEELDILISVLGSAQTLAMLRSIRRVGNLSAIRTIKKDRNYTIAEIIVNETCELFEVDSTKLKAVQKGSASDEMGSARWIAIFLVAKHCSWTLEEVGLYFGGRAKSGISTNYVTPMQVVYKAKNSSHPMISDCLAVEKKLQATLAALEAIERQRRKEVA